MPPGPSPLAAVHPGIERLVTGAAYPNRIVCLTEETTEILYLLGEQERIVGISGFTVRPPEARREKPVVSTFLEARYDEILALEPDLVLGFSDLQADIARDLVRLGVPVFLFNQRSVAEILQAIRVVGALVGAAPAGEALADRLQARLRAIAEAAAALPRRPRVYFEEWFEPLITGIRWVSELIELAGGDDVFAEHRGEQAAAGRTVAPEAVLERAPDVLIASWCGKKAKEAKIRSRQGWDALPALRDDQLYEIKSEYILQPGPAALTDGVEQLARIIAAVARGETLPRRRPSELRSALEPDAD
jgi:iron complex transport system substrate-binding protein